MRALDEHWIAYPRFIAGELDAFERVKLKLLGRPVVRYLDVIMARGVPSAGAAEDEVLVIPGGGTGHPGAGNVTGEFLDAARALASSGFATTFIGPVGADLGGARFRSVGSLPQPELAARMRAARLVVVNGGSTLLQAIACGAACVAAPIAGDQLERIRRCVKAGVALEAAPVSADIERKARSLLEDEGRRAALAERAAGLGLADGIEVALDALGRLIEPA
jgi:UDP:flavonoid glycosyltransferase YjiC (YdhE family)